MKRATIPCRHCEWKIPSDTDDYYNTSQTLIFCPNCGWDNPVPLPAPPEGKE
jgi:Zn finger protein HypA/HybF involved in hydrogenase expression